MRTTLSLVLCVVAAVGCGSGKIQRSGSSTTAAWHPTVVVAYGSELFPNESLRDWVSYADHVAVFGVESDRMLPYDDHEFDVGEGHVPREVALEVEDILWSAPEAPPLPHELTRRTLGWALHDGEMRPLVSPDAAVLEVGRRYVGPVVQVDLGEGSRWWPLVPGSDLPVSDGRVASARWSTHLSAEIGALTMPELARRLQGQALDPDAAGLLYMRPQERIVAVLELEEQRRAPSGSGDSP